MRPITEAASLAPAYDLVVVGAGPAGLAAATTAAELGLATALLDENPAPGGQIYRGITTTPVVNRAVLGKDYWRGTDLAAAFAASSAAYAPGATVWSLGPALDESGREDGLEVGVSLHGAARLIGAREVVLATGALERPFPVPGWTLPGVMTAGGAQTALKASGLVPDGRVVVAGSGPLLYLLVAQLREAGARITALLDTTPRANWAEAARHLPGFMASSYLAKGLGLLWRARRGLRHLRGVTALVAEGEGRLERVVVRQGAAEERIACDLLLLHQGVVPNINLASAAGCAHDWDEVQLAWVPRLDEWLQSTVKGVAIAGDGAGIAGAESAAWRGRLAALGAAQRLRWISGGALDGRVREVTRHLARAGRGRRFLDVLYRPAQAFRVPQDDATVVCRCEEVTAGQIREAVRHGVIGPNQMKSFLRCGMGPCQGRLCGLTVTELIAGARGVGPTEVGAYRLRPPVKPVTLGELAALPKTEAATRAVVR